MNIKINQYAALIQIPSRRANISLGIQIESGYISQVVFLPGNKQTLVPKSDIGLEAIRQIKAYFTDPEWQFTLPTRSIGTAFQQRVWSALTKIKVGQRITYGELAAQLNSSARAVGNACRRNPVPIIVPCHRVVAKSGIGGFSGQREGELLSLKHWLLNRESSYAN